MQGQRWDSLYGGRHCRSCNDMIPTSKTLCALCGRSWNFLLAVPLNLIVIWNGNCQRVFHLILMLGILACIVHEHACLNLASVSRVYPCKPLQCCQ